MCRRNVVVALLIVVVVSVGLAAGTGTFAQAGVAGSVPRDPRVSALRAQVARLTKLLTLTIARQNIQADQITTLQNRKQVATLSVTTQASISTTVPGGYQFTTVRSLICPYGSQVVGGGYQADHGITPIASYPGIGGDWEVVFWNTLSVAATAKAIALCASIG